MKYTIAEDLAHYFDSGAAVCPYARVVRKVFFDNTLDEVAVGIWMQTLFAREVAVVIAPRERSRDYGGARAWCHATFLRLQALVNMGHEIEIAHREEPKFLPYLTAGTATFHTIGMGPQYPAEHPRFAPHLCLVSVNMESIREVSEKDREPIRRVVLGRLGVLYDADEVWLPLRPEGAEHGDREE